MDGQFSEATAAAVGRIRVPRAFVRNPRCAASSVIRRRDVITLVRRSKKRPAAAAAVFTAGWYDRKTRRVRDLSCGDARMYLEIEVRRVAVPGLRQVKRERLEFLADNPFYTKRFAYYVGRRCRPATIKDMAEELDLDWDTVKTLEKQYMRRTAGQGGHAGTEGYRHRRDLDSQGPHLSHRGERSDSAAADLVRGRGPLGGEHGAVL